MPRAMAALGQVAVIVELTLAFGAVQAACRVARGPTLKGIRLNCYSSADAYQKTKRLCTSQA